MKNALSDAEMQVHEIDYINVHGTSTPIGDPQEIKAIEKVPSTLFLKIPQYY
jgi:3-oxoacyl-[acyl-carrier-protein] synthase II